MGDAEPSQTDGAFREKYTVKKQIAKGSYGTVCTSSPVGDPQTIYAVKIIDRSMLKKKDSDAVYREVEILRELFIIFDF